MYDRTTRIVRYSEADLVRKPIKNQNHDVLTLGQFRLALIEFLRLPFDIDETALRERLERTSPSVLGNYLERVQREAILEEAEDTVPMSLLGRGHPAIAK
jgi:hypothetical protein